MIRALLCLTICANLYAAEWQWSVPDGKARVYLWIPERCDKVRGVLLANHNMLEQGILEHPTMRKTLADLGFAEVWAVPVLERAFDFHQGAGEHFQRVMDALATESGYGELSSAPVIPLGHSASATFPWNFAAWNPGRTVAVISVKGDAPQTTLTGYGGANIDWENRVIDGIPGLMVMGEYEWGEERLKPALQFREKYPAAPLAFLGDAGHGHFDCSDELIEFLAAFVRRSAGARLTENGALRPVRTEEGWLIDRWRKDQPPIAPAAPFHEYKGNKLEAFWCFDGAMAREIEEHYAGQRGKKPQALTIVSEPSLSLDKTTGEPLSPRFLPREDGITFELQTGFASSVSTNGNSARWAGRPPGSSLGHGKGPIRLSRITGPVRQLSDTTFAYAPGPGESTEDRRNYDLWILASHPGDEQFKSAVQQCMIRVTPDQSGKSQTIDFAPIPDQPLGTKSIQLRAFSSEGLPVGFYVREGPARVSGSMLTFSPTPPRARFPLRVTVVAWQFGKPGVAAAQPVERSFFLAK